MPSNQPTGQARRDFAKNRKPVGPVVALPQLGAAHTRSPLTAHEKALGAKLRAQARAIFRGQA
jgi:hypothetical protein